MKELFPILSTLIDYPREDFKEKLKSAIEMGRVDCPEVSDELLEFESVVKDMDLGPLQEMYTRTFDVQGVCCLDIGYVLFGEDYKRGEFLVNIQRLQKDNGIFTGVELPDHLTNFLKLLVVIDEEMRLELIEKILIVAVHKMLDGFHHELGPHNFYFKVLNAIEAALRKNFLHDQIQLGGTLC